MKLKKNPFWDYTFLEQVWGLSGFDSSCFQGPEPLLSSSPASFSRCLSLTAPHSSTLAWRIPWAEEPGGLQSLGSLSRTQLSDFTFTFHFHALEKEMATHSSVLAWRIRGKGEPGGLPAMGSHRVGHDWSDLAAAAAALHFWSQGDYSTFTIIFFV